jgi:hypothetical protein
MCSSNAPPSGLNIRPGQITQVRNKTATEVQAQMQAAQQQIQNNMAMQSPRMIHQETMKGMVMDLLPSVCKEHVYQIAHERIVAQDCQLVKWTFFNDTSVRLKVEVDWLQDDCTLRTLCDDFEEWQATAIMQCEAGDDVWPRPKPGSAQQGNSSPNFGQANSLANLQRQQSLLGGQASHINQQAVGNALGNALGLGGLFK